MVLWPGFVATTMIIGSICTAVAAWGYTMHDERYDDSKCMQAYHTVFGLGYLAFYSSWLFVLHHHFDDKRALGCAITVAVLFVLYVLIGSCYFCDTYCDGGQILPVEEGPAMNQRPVLRSNIDRPSHVHGAEKALEEKLGLQNETHASSDRKATTSEVSINEEKPVKQTADKMESALDASVSGSCSNYDETPMSDNQETSVSEVSLPAYDVRVQSQQYGSSSV